MKNVQCDIRELDDSNGRIAVLYLDNPRTRNSMTLEMGMSFHDTIHKLAGDDPQLRALVITGNNDVFSSGGDFNLLKSFAEKDPEENKRYMESFYRLFLDVRNMPFPVIAAVNGHAIGASLALALACDLRYFVPDGKYAFNFVRIGIHPGMGSSFLLKEVAGLTQAQELLLTGRYISGEEAYRRGLCHGLFSREEILDRALEVATEIATAAPQAVRMCKHGLYINRTLDNALEYEAASQAQNYATDDFREA
ncbi:MAG: enoyl-CoA hydratase/isomerase family protein, partial [Leptospiraceae bacterium]|nr:enoyl-CoA hydratase/isomerase family protein [Leptospiraceae bacterium]